MGEPWPLTDARFDLPVEPPIAPGASPFRFSGVVYRGLLDFVAAEVRGGLPQVLAHLDGQVARFVRHDFDRVFKYDALPLPYLAAAIARARHVSFEQQLLDSNRWSEARAGAIYRTLLAVLSPEAVAVAIPRATAVVHDFGKVTARVVGPNRVSGTRSGVPAPLVRWFAVSVGTYFELALKRAGAKQPHVRFLHAERDGVVANVETYAMPFDVRWS